MNKEDFPMFKQNITYLDNGATTFKPKCVIDKIADYYSNYCANAHRGDYDISYKVDMEYENTRDLVKEFINAKSKEEIVFTSGCTESLNIIVSGFFERLIDVNDEIILTKSEHASNVLPWFRIAKQSHAKIKYIPLTKDHHVTLENLKSIITPQTKIIALVQMLLEIKDQLKKFVNLLMKIIFLLLLTVLKVYLI